MSKEELWPRLAILITAFVLAYYLTKLTNNYEAKIDTLEKKIDSLNRIDSIRQEHFRNCAFISNDMINP